MKRLIWLLSTAMLVSGCATTFHGPAPLTIGNEEEPDKGPSVTWSGARQYVQPDDAFNFDWPLDDAKLSRGFSVGGRRSHWGLDLANHKGTPILASERGVVIYTGHGFHGYGNLIVIEHNEEWATLYGHLSKILVKEGDKVRQGQKIGLMGRTGRATGVHLHFEVRYNRQPINPLGVLPAGMGTATP